MPVPTRYNLYIPVAYGNIKTKLKIGTKVQNIQSYTYESKGFTELDKLFYLAKILKTTKYQIYYFGIYM